MWMVLRERGLASGHKTVRWWPLNVGAWGERVCGWVSYRRAAYRGGWERASSGRMKYLVGILFFCAAWFG